MKIIDIGYILIDNINSKNDLNKLKLINTIETYKNEIKDKKQKEIDNINKYKIDYENKRKANYNNYEQYLRENKILYDKWIKSKKTKDFLEYISFKKPEYEEIPDIYTINPTSLH
jgi:superfamily I DNA/RNA helicase